MRRDKVNCHVCDADGDDCSLDAEDDGVDEFFVVHDSVVLCLTLVLALLLCRAIHFDGECHHRAILIEVVILLPEGVVHGIKDVQEFIESDIVPANVNHVNVPFIHDAELGRRIARHDVGQDGGG